MKNVVRTGRATPLKGDAHSIQPSIRSLSSTLGGVDLIRRPILAGSSVPVLVISACDDPGKRIEALDAGAADFITSSLHVKELVARIHAVVRRKAGYASSQMMNGAGRARP